MPRKAGGGRRKRRTHKIDNDQSEDKVARSFVIRRGHVPNGIRDLVPELRNTLMPYTATRLKERRMNSLKDFVSIGTQLGVSHLWILSATAKGPYLRIGKLAQGPTSTFRIVEYSLACDIRAMQRRPVLLTDADLTVSPLLIMNNFNANLTTVTPSSATITPDEEDSKKTNQQKAIELVSQTLKHSFPPLDVNTTKLSGLKRVLLIHRDLESGLIYVRHYALRLLQAGLSTSVRKMVQKKRIPKMSQLNDVSQILEKDLQHTLFSSDSEAGGGGLLSGPQGTTPSTNQVKLPQPVKQLRKGANTTVKLTEVGPRLTLQLVKIQAGLCDGAVLYHQFETRSDEQARDTEQRITQRKELKRKRREEQDANVKRKEDAKRAKKERRKQAAENRMAAVTDEGVEDEE